ncbi:amino acid ABC transporter permease [uncultured Cohaesibacter sp.]|uniref:amino acid ABC transporter permease n=1 Tax=uncultured Cohaesibacter sp. TaxID=1002546 RepID=UPI00292F9569|nr:amino acid ABC transporter permease [uncultured Cohaesibacter sp.]
MAYEMNFAPVLARAPELIDGAIATIELSAKSICIGLIIGLGVALIRFNRVPILKNIAAFYVETFRNTPLLVQLFLLFFGLPFLGVRLTATESAIVAVSLNLGAYSAEIFRAGLDAIPKTQIEAGLALGLSRLQTMRYVVILPALKVIYPSLTGQLTLTLLGTSITSAISATELTLAGAKIESQTFRSLETYIVLAVMYIAITFTFRAVYTLVGKWLFRRKVPKASIVAATIMDEETSQ